MPIVSTKGLKALVGAALASALYVTSLAQELNGSGSPSASTAHLGLPALMTEGSSHSDPALVELGRRLFFEKQLSRDGSISCSSCHRPESFYSDSNRFSKGVEGSEGTRNAPSLLNAAFNTSQFWDGRAETLEIQALMPLTNPKEMAMPDLDAVLAFVRADQSYRRLFLRTFKLSAPDEIRAEQLAAALAAFEETLLSGNSAFDRYQYAGQSQALGVAAIRGLALFRGRAGCISCHRIGEHDALFTDNQFHASSVGLALAGEQLASVIDAFVNRRSAGESLESVVSDDRSYAELGRYLVTLRPGDIGKFRTPSLRDVAVTAPYMHDGSVSSLEEAVDLEVYYRSAQGGPPLLVTPDERQDLVEFLRSLTGSYAPPTEKGP